METQSGRTSQPSSRDDGLSQLRIVGGNAGIDLCNSRSGPHDGGVDLDVLRGPDDLVPWAVHAKVITADEAASLVGGSNEAVGASASVMDADFVSALALREHTHAVFQAISAHRLPETVDLDALRIADAAAIGRANLARSGSSFEFAWPATTTTAIVDRIAHAAAVLLTEGPLDRVKQCGGCSFLFVDESKNGSRRWCSMDDCGREAKMRLYVERRRERQSRAATSSP